MDEVEPQSFPSSFFSKHTRKSTQLINNKSPEQALDGRHSWYLFELSEPAFVESISVTTEGYSKWHELELCCELPSGKEFISKQKLAEADTVFSVDRVITAFRFRPATKFGKTSIQCVVVSGLTLQELSSYEKVVKERSSVQETISSLQIKHNELSSSISQLQAEQSELTSNVGRAVAELSTLESSIEASKATYQSISSDLKDVEAQLGAKRDERRVVSTSLAELKGELKMFPSEIAGFVREGNRSFKWYIILMVPFLCILFYVLHQLFSKAVDLTQLWRTDDIDVWTVFLTRIPFVLVAIALIETCGYVVGRFIFEIIRINRQRLELAKLSIVARDVSGASAHDTDLSSEEVFDRETKLKMEMLREYMSGYSGAEFEYRGSALMSSILKVASRLTGSKPSD